MTRFVVLVVLIVATVGHCSQAHAKTDPQASVPVNFRLSINDRPALVTVMSGSLARIEVRDRGTFGLVPLPRDGGVSLTLVKIAPDPEAGTDLTWELATVWLVVGSRLETTLGDMPLAVELLEPGSPQRLPSASTGPCLACCVTCGDLTVCSCYVELECARCCCPAGGCGCVSDLQGATDKGDRSHLTWRTNRR